MSRGYFAYPCYAIQGQQVDMTSANNSVPIDAAGSRVEFTDITFVNEGDATTKPPGAATLAANFGVLRDANEIVTTTSNSNFGNHSQLPRGGNKSIHFMPKIHKLEIEIGGQSYPGSATYDRVYDNPERAYKLYKELFTEDERKIKFRDWIYRYFKM